MMMLEKSEECPQCGEIKRWLYDAQICAACGHGDRYKESREIAALRAEVLRLTEQMSSARADGFAECREMARLEAIARLASSALVMAIGRLQPKEKK